MRLFVICSLLLAIGCGSRAATPTPPLRTTAFMRTNVFLATNASDLLVRAGLNQLTSPTNGQTADQVLATNQWTIIESNLQNLAQVSNTFRTGITTLTNGPLALMNLSLVGSNNFLGTNVKVSVVQPAGTTLISQWMPGLGWLNRIALMSNGTFTVSNPKLNPASGGCLLQTDADGVISENNADYPVGTLYLTNLVFMTNNASAPRLKVKAAGLELVGGDDVASPTNNLTVSGNITAGNGYTGDGSGFTNLSAASVSGKFPAAGFGISDYADFSYDTGTDDLVISTTFNPNTLKFGHGLELTGGVFTGDGSGLTNCNAAAFTQGTLTLSDTNCTFDASTVTPSHTVFSLLATNNVYFTQPTGLAAGQQFVIYVRQDATGSRSVNFNRTYWKFSGGTVLSASPAANALDAITCVVGPEGTNVNAIQVPNFQ